MLFRSSSSASVLAEDELDHIGRCAKILRAELENRTAFRDPVTSELEYDAHHLGIYSHLPSFRYAPAKPAYWLTLLVS